MACALDDAAGGHHHQRQQRARERQAGARRRQRRPAGEPRPHPDRHFADAQPVAAQEQHELGLARNRSGDGAPSSRTARGPNSQKPDVGSVNRRPRPDREAAGERRLADAPERQPALARGRREMKREPIAASSRPCDHRREHAAMSQARCWPSPSIAHDVLVALRARRIACRRAPRRRRRAAAAA